MDHVWTNILDRPIRTAVLCNPISDHLPSFVNIAVNKVEKKQIIQRRNFSDRNIALFHENICKIEVSDILKETRTNNAYDLLWADTYQFLMILFPMKI